MHLSAAPVQPATYDTTTNKHSTPPLKFSSSFFENPTKIESDRIMEISSSVVFGPPILPQFPVNFADDDGDDDFEVDVVFGVEVGGLSLHPSSLKLLVSVKGRRDRCTFTHSLTSHPSFQSPPSLDLGEVALCFEEKEPRGCGDGGTNQHDEGHDDGEICGRRGARNQRGKWGTNEHNGVQLTHLGA
ncbi:hypothetical protein niasHT_029043 [Heterodera trifolii]|uniref:Uncharacterized protein n=1 Tax=Heterodera trifolii TaxID=157864 RepID=A0ABD2KC61_9BILA